MSDEQESVPSSLSFQIRPSVQGHGCGRQDARAAFQGNNGRANRRFSGFCPRCGRKMSKKPKTKRTLVCEHCEIEVTPKWKRTRY